MAAALYRWGRRDAEAHTHTHCVIEKKKHCRMLEPFSNTLEDHAKHKVRELGCVPLFPTLLRPLELCHQLINEHNAISFPLSLSQYVIWSFSIHFMLRHRSLNPWIVWGSECVVSGSFLLCDCMYASSI